MYYYLQLSGRARQDLIRIIYNAHYEMQHYGNTAERKRSFRETVKLLDLLRVGNFTSLFYRGPGW